MPTADFCTDADTLAQLGSWEAFFANAAYARLSIADALTLILDGTAPRDSNEVHPNLMPEDFDLVLAWARESTDPRLHALAARCEVMAAEYNAAETLAEALAAVQDARLYHQATLATLEALQGA